jgi:hypothetical protein
MAIGDLALSNNLSGANTATGFAALSANTSGFGNTGVGFQALMNNTTGANTVFGFDALLDNTAGFNNVAVGVSALLATTTGTTTRPLVTCRSTATPPAIIT